MQTIEIANNYCIGYSSSDLSFFNYYDVTEIDIVINDSLTCEFFGTKSAAIARLLELNINTFDVPIALSGMDIDNILKVKIYSDNVLVAYNEGQPVYSDNILTGYTEKQNPSKEYMSDKLKWITKEELKLQCISGYISTDYIFSAKVLTKKVKKSAPYYDFAISLNNQKTPFKKNKDEITSYLIYLNINDGFNIDPNGKIINLYSEDIEIKQLTTDVIINSDNEIRENK